MNFDTIAAIATPVGSGGVGIIRISGDKSVPIVLSIFRSYSPGKSKHLIEQNTTTAGPKHLKSHTVFYGHIIDPDDQSIIDETLILTMLAPRSYTREDVVEIHSHSNYVVLNLILDLLIKKGARLAEPGEFTKRAFLNGRIDLTQVESIIDIINARTENALKIATSHISGRMKNTIIDIKNYLVDFLALIDASIDFPDDVKEIVNTDKAALNIQTDVLNKVDRLLMHYSEGYIFREGLNITIIGQPNVGKSSIMNCLTRNNRVIVSPLPGTTRDLIFEAININGIPINLCDTAGLHDSSNTVESIGINKVYDNLPDTDLVLFVIDAARPDNDENTIIYNKIKDKKIIFIINKSDLIPDNKTCVIPDFVKPADYVLTSALYNSGIDSLRNLIVKAFTGGTDIKVSSHVVPNVRHKTALEAAKESAIRAIDNLNRSAPWEIIALDIKASVDALNSIIGKNADINILDQIFNKFCIGK